SVLRLGFKKRESLIRSGALVAAPGTFPPMFLLCVSRVSKNDYAGYFLSRPTRPKISAMKESRGRISPAGGFPMRFHFSLSLLTALSLLIAPLEAGDYKYPYHDPYLATATTAILSDDGATPRADSIIVQVPGLAGRNHLPSLEGRGHVSLAFYPQRRSAPLIFILAGLGSNPYFGVAPYLASLFYRQGFHVVILPSPMSWNFALAASRSGAPGYAPEDARDLYAVMQNTMTVLRGRHGVKSTSINLLAVSLGALEGAHLSVIDRAERKIGIDRYLLVNPPVDLAYAVDKIDEWSALKRKFGREKSQEIV